MIIQNNRPWIHLYLIPFILAILLMCGQAHAQQLCVFQDASGQLHELCCGDGVDNDGLEGADCDDPDCEAEICNAEAELCRGGTCGTQAPSNPLQGIIDACAPNTVCALPRGSFVINQSLRVTKPIQLVGRGRSFGILRFLPFTEIRVVQPPGSRPIPAIQILTEGEVGIQDLNTVGGGIRVGGRHDPCRGIDSPVDSFPTRVNLSNIFVRNSASDGVSFDGESVTAEDVIVNNAEGTGLYIANATNDIVLQNNSFLNNDGFGLYICNLKGSGEIFINQLNTALNGHGGTAIVGKGGPPPNERRLCMQNSTANFNSRVGVLLFEVAPSLLFNVRAGFNLADSNGILGDGISISHSEEVYLWNVTTALNSRAGYSFFELNPGETMIVNGLGEYNSLNNSIHTNLEGSAFIDGKSGQTTIGPFCGFPSLTAPPFEDHCEENFQEVICTAVSSNLTPPPAIPPTNP